MYIGFSCLRFLSQFAKTGLGIVPFGGTQHTYTFKQPILAAAGFPAGALDALESASAGKIACPTSIFEEGSALCIRAADWTGGAAPLEILPYFSSHPSVASHSKIT
jgi:hypothetical protein